MIAAPIRGGDAAARLARGLVEHARRAGLQVEAGHVAARPWASATYVGTQVTLLLAAPRSPTLGGWIGALPEAEVPMAGHLLASVALDRIEDDGQVLCCTVTALVIEA